MESIEPVEEGTEILEVSGIEEEVRSMEEEEYIVDGFLEEVERQE